MGLVALRPDGEESVFPEASSLNAYHPVRTHRPRRAREDEQTRERLYISRVPQYSAVRSLSAHANHASQTAEELRVEVVTSSG